MRPGITIRLLTNEIGSLEEPIAFMDAFAATKKSKGS